MQIIKDNVTILPETGCWVWNKSVSSAGYGQFTKNGINGNNQKRSSTQYARYKLSVSLSRYLTKDETVDHIDNNKTNNDLSNLQILSIGDNVRKSHKKPLFVTNCFICGKSFNVKRNLTIEQKLKCKNNELCCSRECGHKKSVITAKANRLTKLNP